MSFRAKLHVTERRRSERRTGDTSGTIANGGITRTVIVRDLSLHGFRAEGAAESDVGAVVHLQLAGPKPVEARVIWREGKAFGCEFVTPISAVALADAFSGRAVVG
ncbi:PilZ domain-containing protein [Sphingomonas nostoxanthinifaciens]|uniref:PilZ domain-containing protein n=1 Tax=Sphingomonas nostoxanthinifaciens TaxID=2872652 RepID=UPI001CC205A8|nr:PilZ domain-containing protein [Sphingomonas nostoxanthinifaciens]UAK25372.1 PilZ domain-containing protein [Sphingomonas nostoxanthinifaciens]